MKNFLPLLLGVLAVFACTAPSSAPQADSAAVADAAQPEVRYYVINDA